MPGFGDMKLPDGQYAPPLPREEQEQFQLDVEALFPESTSSRLARACGGVNNRTAQKWIQGSITPPDDVLEYVRTQRKILNDKLFYPMLRAWVDKNAVGMDFEVVAGQVAGLYKEMTGYDVR